jgi:glycosyltransferase involved in cell wall biosynthesis
VRIGVPERIAAAAGRVPAGISSTLGALPGRAFTALGMAGSVRDYQRMQRELFSLVDRFVVLNETGRRMLLANGSPADKLVLNRLGVSFTNGESKAAPAIRSTSSLVRFGYVGRLHPTKGLAELMRAVAAIPTAVDFRLEVRGPILDEETRRFAGELIDQCRHDSRVTIGGGIDSADVPAFLAGLDVLLCPSMWFENGPTVALEAMAVGTPVIASRLGNLAEAIVDDVTGKLLPPGDVAKWAAAIADVAGTPPTVDRWRAALPPARTMDDIAVDYLALYAA